MTTSLSLENAIQEAVDGDRVVYVVGAKGQTYKRLTRLGLLDIVPADHFVSDRMTALKQALAAVNPMDAQPIDTQPMDTQPMVNVQPST